MLDSGLLVCYLIGVCVLVGGLLVPLDRRSVSSECGRRCLVTELPPAELLVPSASVLSSLLSYKYKYKYRDNYKFRDKCNDSNCLHFDAT